jgi:hypothetical protein
LRTSRATEAVKDIGTHPLDQMSNHQCTTARLAGRVLGIGVDFFPGSGEEGPQAPVSRRQRA